MKTRHNPLTLRCVTCLLLLAFLTFTADLWAAPGNALEAGFRNPPQQSRMHCYWWWLNGHTNEATITRDLEEMKAKGYGGVLLVDADGASQFGNKTVPAGPLFGSSEWRKLYRHALREAARLGLEISLNITSGWNLGGPSVTPAEASKILTFSRQVVSGPAEFAGKLAHPPQENSFYQDIGVVAYPLHAGTSLAGNNGDQRNPIRRLEHKAAFKEVGFSAPVTTPLLEDFPARDGEEDTHLNEVRDLTTLVKGDELTWDIPAGAWEILRIGYTHSNAHISTASNGWQGLVIDYMDRSALQSYWDKNVAPLLSDARPYIGQSLRYLVTDSWELKGTNWTPRFREEFQRRRGYDLLPYLAIISGRIVESRDSSNRFLNDFRKTIGELIAEEHYQTFAELAKRNGLGIHPESGGPHGAPIDALRTLSMSSFPQTEYWAKSDTHRTTDADRFFIKEASSAAHIYGKKLVAAEGMTSIGPQWEEVIWSNLRPSFDQAICAGMNLLFWHTFTSSPAEAGLPGQEYFAGTHLNPNVTWWNYAGSFVSYINRTQFLMQQGMPVADVLYYYGDHVPNFVQLKGSDPAKVLPGYDYDVTDEEALITRLTVKNGRLMLPDGISYRMLALGDRPYISLKALSKVRELVFDGATVVGTRPQRTTGIVPDGDAKVQKIATELWGNCGESGASVHKFGRGYVYCGTPVRSVLHRQRVLPDFEFKSAAAKAALDYVHSRAGEADIYFVRNATPDPVYAQLTLRVAGKKPEFWHPDSGVIEDQPLYQATNDGRTAIPVWLEPFGSVAVLLRSPQTEHLTQLTRDGQQVFPIIAGGSNPEVKLQTDKRQGWTLETASPGKYRVKTSAGAVLSAEATAGEQNIEGGWTIQFPAGWGAPASLQFEHLHSWTEERQPGVRYFSGTATYSKTIGIPADLLQSGRHLYLDLGDVREIASVKLNGKDAGIAWTKPFRIELTGVAKPGSNELEIAVTNLWPNRLIGDQQLSPEQRLTRTNITKFRADSPLLASGLLGPVHLIRTSRVRLRRDAER